MHLALKRENLDQFFSDFPDDVKGAVCAALGSYFLPLLGKRPLPRGDPPGHPRLLRAHYSLQPPGPQHAPTPPNPYRALAHTSRGKADCAAGRVGRRMRQPRPPLPPPAPLRGSWHRGAWRARGPALPLAAGPCGGPRVGAGRLAARLERGRRWQRGEGGGGSAWEQAAYAWRGRCR